MENKNKLATASKIYRIIYAVLNILFIAFVAYLLIDALIKDANTVPNDGSVTLENINIVAALLLYIALIGPLGYGVLLLLGVVDLILTIIAINKKAFKKNGINIFISILLIIGPAIQYLLYILIFYINIPK